MDIRGPRANTMGLSRGDHALGMKVIVDKVLLEVRWTMIHGGTEVERRGG
jgi:hypothetical protein